jgi:hypothetical protein
MIMRVATVSNDDARLIKELERKFQIIRDRVSSVVNNYHTACHLVGRPGTSKTFTVKKELDRLKVPYAYRNARMTPMGMFDFIAEYPEHIHGGDRKSEHIYNSGNNALSAEEAAELVGLKKDTYFRAMKVVEKGCPELIKAMDDNNLSIYAASVIADADHKDQQACLAKGSNEERWTAKAAKKRMRTAKRTREHNEAMDKTVSIPLSNYDFKLYHCPFQDLETIAGIKPDSVNMLITDIPYDKGFVPQVSDLASMASRIPVEGGLFVMYSGQYWLLDIMKRLGEHLTYRWMCASVWDGDANLIHPLDLTSKWKPIMIFSKGEWKKRGRWLDIFKVESKEKQWHDWEQPLEEAERLIHYFSQDGDLVVDCCAGSFTTAIACYLQNRRFVGCDIDKAAVVSGQERLAQERAKRDTHQDIVLPVVEMTELITTDLSY